MSLAVGNVIQFTLRGVWNSIVATRDIFFYEASAVNEATPDSLFDQLQEAASAFWGYINPSLAVVTSNRQKYTQIDAKLVRGTGEGTQNLFLIPSEEQLGDVDAECMPSFVAWGFRYQGAGGAERNGYKRFAGVPETAIIDGVAAGGVTGQLNTIAGKLSDNVTVFGGIGGIVNQATIYPVIAKKMAGGLDPSDISILSTWRPVGVVYYGVTTQNTRKVGRGI